MGKVFKWLAGIFVGVLLISVVAVGVLLALLDEETIKTQLADVAHQQTGGELGIDGELGLSVFPQLGVAVDQLHFTPRDEQSAIAKIGKLRLGVDVMSLFRGKLNVDEISLTGVRLDLVKDKSGAGNWEKLLPEQTEPATEPAPSPEPPPETDDKAGGINLAISKLNIADAQINYADQQTGDSYQLADFSMQSEAVNLAGESFPATIGFAVNAPQMALKFDLDTLLSGDLEAERFALDELASIIVVTGEATGGKTISTKLSTNALVDLGADIANLEHLRIELADLVITGLVNVTQLSSDPRITAKLHSQAFNPSKLAGTLGIELPPFTNKQALQHARFSSQITATPKSAKLHGMNIDLDKTRVTGRVAITDFDKQALQAKLNVNQFNLDDYQLVSAQTEHASSTANAPAAGGGKTGAQGNGESATLLPLETIRSLNVNAALTVGKLGAAGMTLSDVLMQLTARNGLVNLSKLNAKLYQGTANIKASIDAQAANPVWTINTKVKNVQAGPMLKAAGDIDWIEGVFAFNGNLTTRGNNQRAVMKNLRGPANFSMRKGVLKEMNLEKMVCQGIALINQKSLNQNWGPDTQLNAITGKLKFGDGKVVNESLTAGLKNTQLKGSGDINMLRNKMAYELGIRVLGTMREVDPACEVNKRYRNIYWPLRCAGDLSEEPSKLCGVDDAAMGDIARKMLEEEVRHRAGDELENKAKDEFKRLLDRL